MQRKECYRRRKERLESGDRREEPDTGEEEGRRKEHKGSRMADAI